MFEASALFTGAKRTIVLVTLTVLVDNLLKRCTNNRVDAIIYGQGILRFAKIIIISIDKAISPECQRFIQNRSEEHTSELQSLRHLVCRLLLEKKKEHNHT